MKINRYKITSWVSDFLIALPLIFIVIITLYPFILVASVSVSESSAVLAGRVNFLPKGFTLSSYSTVLKNPYIVKSYMNTILYTTVGTAINLIMTVLTAYPLTKKKFYGRKFFTLLVTFTMAFNGGIMPTYILVNNLGLRNSIWALVLPMAIITYNLLIVRTFFLSIPESLEEAAIIDGCGDFRVLFLVVLPLSIPIMVTIGLFYAVWHWNSFFSPLIYLDKKDMWPLQIILRSVVIDDDMAASSSGSEYVVGEAIKYATIMVATLPIMCAYPFIQKYFVKGVMLGSVKG